MMTGIHVGCPCPSEALGGVLWAGTVSGPFFAFILHLGL